MVIFENMKIGARLGWGFGLMVLLIVASGLFTWKSVHESELHYKEFQDDTRGAVLLSEAQNALWELRYGFLQFMVGDAAGRAKIVSDEPKLKARIDETLKQYAKLDIGAQEKAKLDELLAVYEKYMAARPKWFDLYGAGKLDEAKEWRAATTTPFGGGTVKGFRELIELQQKAGEQVAAAAAAELKQLKLFTILLIVMACLAGSMLALIVARSITRPLNEALNFAQKVAEGDLTGTVEVKSKDETGQLLQALKGMNDRLQTIVGDVRSGTDSITTASKEIASGNADLSQRTEEQASSLEETASSMEELTSTVKQNAENARQANQLAVGASDVAVRGGEVVKQVVGTMNGISDSSKKIADIIGVIDGIAFQTNILALNAAVEAARAGEQGRGFAVVATEVRNLAQRSAAAAKEIKGLITDSVTRVDAGTQLVDEAGRTMDEIVSSVKRVTDIVAEISAASQEQSSGIEQVNQAITQMDEVTQQNAALVEEAAAAAESMQEQAQNLTQAVSVFKLAQSDGSTVVLRKAERPAASVTSLPVRTKTVERKPVAPKARKVANAKPGSEEWQEF